MRSIPKITSGAAAARSAVSARTRVGRRAVPTDLSERATRAPLGWRALSADTARTSLRQSLSFIEDEILSPCTKEKSQILTITNLALVQLPRQSGQVRGEFRIRLQASSQATDGHAA